MKKFKLIISFYKSFLVATIAITIVSAFTAQRYGFHTVVPLFWLKILSSSKIYFSIKTYKSKEFYYYQNLGISKTQLRYLPSNYVLKDGKLHAIKHISEIEELGYAKL